MTELIPGKWYRVTANLKATVNLGLCDGDGNLIFTHADVMSISALTLELLPDPLPTTPGSVVRVEAQVFMRCYSQFGEPWVGEDGSGYHDSQLKGAVVLFDAGVERA